MYSGQLLQDLMEKGMPRDDAYKAVQENAMAAWESDTSFRERVPAMTRGSQSIWMRRRWRILSICSGSFATWMRFSLASSVRC